MSEKKDLVQIIKDNPGCHAVIDNDCWWLYREDPANAPEGNDAYEAWEKQNLLARDGEVTELGDGGYGTGCSYGGDIFQALAVIVGLKVESV